MHLYQTVYYKYENMNEKGIIFYNNIVLELFKNHSPYIIKNKKISEHKVHKEKNPQIFLWSFPKSKIFFFTNHQKYYLLFLFNLFY